jgi:hypothetical protein
MRLHLGKCDEYSFLLCLKYSVWGSDYNRFKDWQKGDYLLLIIDKSFAALAEMIGEPFISKDEIWPGGGSPYRIPIKFIHIPKKESRPLILGKSRDALLAAYGSKKWGWAILNQTLIPESASHIIYNEIISIPNHLKEITEQLDVLLQEEKSSQKFKEVVARKQDTKIIEKPITAELQITESEIKNTLHTQTEFDLIRLGKMCGCTVWVAKGDRNKLINGKSLGNECMEILPKMGLDEEDIRRVSNIDVIWFERNKPIYAFEIETTTQIYSGILRMSDLLEVVPALRIKLIIVAPKEKESKFKSEIERPTFRYVGLYDYCKFISIEKLKEIIHQAEIFAGHLQSSIIEKYAVGFSNEI